MTKKETKKFMYKVFPDCDSGGWFVLGPTDQPHLPKWVPPAKEIAEAVCSALNSAYEKGKEATE